MSNDMPEEIIEWMHLNIGNVSQDEYGRTYRFGALMYHHLSPRIKELEESNDLNRTEMLAYKQIYKEECAKNKELEQRVKELQSQISVEEMADNDFASSEAIEFADWLLKMHMGFNGFGGWQGRINTNYYGSSSLKLYELFKKEEHKVFVKSIEKRKQDEQPGDIKTAEDGK